MMGVSSCLVWRLGGSDGRRKGGRLMQALCL